MAATHSAPSFALGTGGFGVSWTLENSGGLASALSQYHVKLIDTAAVYPMHDPGAAEKILGDLGFPEKGFTVSTKILHMPPGGGSLSRDKMQSSIKQSLESLRLTKVDILYAHAPDKDTPIAIVAENFDILYRQGLFERLGVCNFSPQLLLEWFKVAAEKGYVKPVVYQGQYNAFCRTYEKTLFPILREHRLSFAAYSPLAGGFLTGKLTLSTSPEDLIGTRFEQSESNYMGKGFRHWYDKPSFHEAIRSLKKVCDVHQVSLSGAALRWLLFHSQLEETDQIIIGPSNIQQLIEYGKAREAGALPDSLADKFDALWEDVEEDGAVIIQS